MLYSKNAQISPCKSQNKYEGEDTKERKKEEEEERRRRWNTVYPLSCNSTSPRCCQKELTAPPLLTESERYRSGIHGLVVVVVSAALWQFNIIVVFDVVVVVLFNFFFHSNAHTTADWVATLTSPIYCDKECEGGHKTAIICVPRVTIGLWGQRSTFSPKDFAYGSTFQRKVQQTKSKGLAEAMMQSLTIVWEVAGNDEVICHNWTMVNGRNEHNSIIQRERWSNDAVRRVNRSGGGGRRTQISALLLAPQNLRIRNQKWKLHGSHPTPKKLAKLFAQRKWLTALKRFS